MLSIANAVNHVGYIYKLFTFTSANLQVGVYSFTSCSICPCYVQLTVESLHFSPLLSHFCSYLCSSLRLPFRPLPPKPSASHFMSQAQPFLDAPHFSPEPHTVMGEVGDHKCESYSDLLLFFYFSE